MLGGVGDTRPVLLHLPVGPDPDGRTDDADGLLAVHHLLAVSAVSLHHAPVGVAQQRIRKLVLRRELAMRLRGVRGYTDDDGVGFLNLLPIVAKAARFLRA